MKILSHEQLEISFAELGAILAVRELLAKKLLKFVEAKRGYVTPSQIKGKHLFNMAVACDNDEHCGSVGCIGGTMALVMGLDRFKASAYVNDAIEQRRTNLAKLFFPGYPWDEFVAFGPITPKQAIKAIDNFLVGKEPWPQSLIQKLEKVQAKLGG